MHGFVLLAFSTVATGDNVKFIPFFAAIHAVFRVLFIIGYKIHNKARVLGFVGTFMPTLFCLYLTLTQIRQGGLTKF